MAFRPTQLLLALPLVFTSCVGTEDAPDLGQMVAIEGDHIGIGVMPSQAWRENAIAIYSKGTGSNLIVEVLEQGTGATVQNGDQAKVHYRGWVTGNDVQFDSSFDRDEPFVFGVGGGRVIKGWDVGVEGLTVGSRVRLHISPEFGYGERSPSGKIPANSTLIFDVQILGVN
jgi:FKBP-type peptidyl-prolyl cis-trans isomerase